MNLSSHKNASASVLTVYYKNNNNLCKRGVSFHWWDSGYTSLHNHDYYEIFIITSGKTNHTLNDVCQELPAKTICLIRPEDCHQFTPITGQRCIHINLSIRQDKLEQLCQSIGISTEKLLAYATRTFQLTDNDFSFFKNDARELNCLLDSDEHSEFTTMLIFEMIVHAIILLNKQRLPFSNSTPEWMNQLLQRIHSPEYLGCRASDIYALSGYSPPVIIDYFKQYTGETVVSYLTKVKLDFAKKLLLSTNLTVLDIACSLGYSSLSHFNKKFRSAFGMSPGEYRQQNQDTTHLFEAPEMQISVHAKEP